MNVEEAYKAKGIAITQIEMWQQRLKEANAVIGQDLLRQQQQKSLEKIDSCCNGESKENGLVATGLLE